MDRAFILGRRAEGWNVRKTSVKIINHDFRLITDIRNNDERKKENEGKMLKCILSEYSEVQETLAEPFL